MPLLCRSAILVAMPPLRDHLPLLSHADNAFPLLCQPYLRNAAAFSSDSLLCLC